MARSTPPADVLLARHWLTHPGESAYSAAQHMHLEPRTVQKAANRLRDRVGTDEAALLNNLRENPIPPLKTATFRHPNPERWIRRAPVHLLISGEGAAADIDGWDLAPHRQLAYVALHDLERAAEDILNTGGRLVDPEGANLTLRAPDPWMIEEPEGYAERGQRLLDYLQSKNVQFLIQLRGKLPGVDL